MADSVATKNYFKTKQASARQPNVYKIILYQPAESWIYSVFQHVHTSKTSQNTRRSLYLHLNRSFVIKSWYSTLIREEIQCSIFTYAHWSVTKVVLETVSCWTQVFWMILGRRAPTLSIWAFVQVLSRLLLFTDMLRLRYATVSHSKGTHTCDGTTNSFLLDSWASSSHAGTWRWCMRFTDSETPKFCDVGDFLML